MSALRENTNRICDLSDGNPGALTIMCVGTQRHGGAFLDAIEARGLRGSNLYSFCKDECGLDTSIMLLRLVTEEPQP